MLTLKLWVQGQPMLQNKISSKRKKINIQFGFEIDSGNQAKCIIPNQ